MLLHPLAALTPRQRRASSQARLHLLDHMRHRDFRVLLEHAGHQAITADVIDALRRANGENRDGAESGGVEPNATWAGLQCFLFLVLQSLISAELKSCVYFFFLGLLRMVRLCL